MDESIGEGLRVIEDRNRISGLCRVEDDSGQVSVRLAIGLDPDRVTCVGMASALAV